MRTILTPAELRTVELMLEGFPDKEIARLTNVKQPTVRSRFKVVFAKLAIDTKLFSPRVRLAFVAHLMRDQLGVTCSSCVKADSVPAGCSAPC